MINNVRYVCIPSKYKKLSVLIFLLIAVDTNLSNNVFQKSYKTILYKSPIYLNINVSKS